MYDINLNLLLGIVCGPKRSTSGSQEWAPGIWPCKRQNLLTMAHL